MRRRIAPLIAAVLLIGCTEDDAILPLLGDELAVGTWGGQNAGVLVDDSLAHVHVGCTLGNFPRPATIDQEGHFSVSGEYVLRAYPVAIGPSLPAQFAGTLRGRNLTLTVAVNDTTQQKLVLLGPVNLTFDREPRLGPCPICRVPKAILP
jgi:hypothetical protein